MKRSTRRTVALGLAGIVGTTLAAEAQEPHSGHHRTEQHAAASLVIPSSIQQEHDSLHARLARIVAYPGDVGEAASRVARLLHEHFGAEEALAMPLLGLLSPLAAHQPIEGADAAIETAHKLREALPTMLDEHRKMKEALEALRAAALHAGDVDVITFADDLMLHARNEEEVLYPAALLVGEALERGPAHH
jgi:hypothetical protein